MSCVWGIALIVLSLIGSALSGPSIGLKPDDIAHEAGMSLIRHSVETSDGYILELWRLNDYDAALPQSQLSQRQPVLFVHGFMDVGLTGFYNARNVSLGYLLWDAGYDVWTVNCRGTTFSKGHSKLLNTDQKYWDWTWDEIALFDVPASMSYIVSKSVWPKVTLIGHSMGGSVLSALLTEGPSNGVNMAQISKVVLLSPATYMANMGVFGHETLSKMTYQMVKQYLVKNLGTMESLPRETVDPWIVPLCYYRPEVCKTFLDLFAGSGPDPDPMDLDRIHVYTNFYPGGSSMTVLFHYLQLFYNKRFARYDWGREENMKKYGQASAPDYRLSDIPKNIPLFVLGGMYDLLSAEDDMMHYHRDLLNLKLKDYTFEMLETYAHGDFIWANNISEIFGYTVVDWIEDRRDE